VLLNPGILLVVSSTLVLHSSKSNGSWEQHFFDIRRSFFVIVGLVPVGAMLRDWILLETPVVTWYHLPELLMTSIYIVGWSTANRRIQLILALTGLMVLITFTASIWLQPGAGRAFVQ